MPFTTSVCRSRFAGRNGKEEPSFYRTVVVVLAAWTLSACWRAMHEPSLVGKKGVKHCSRHAQYYWYVSGPVSARPRAHVAAAHRAMSLAIVLPRSGVCTCRLRACARPMLSTASCSTHELPRFTPMMTPDLLPCQDGRGLLERGLHCGLGLDVHWLSAKLA